MRQAQCLLLFVLLVPQRQCNLLSPEGLKGQIEDALRPYFPNVRAFVDPQRQGMAGFTCTQGLGSDFVLKVQGYMATDRDIQQKLNLIPIAGLFSGSHYKYFLLGFDGGFIRYDFDTRQIDTLAMNSAALQTYRQTCGFSAQ